MTTTRQPKKQSRIHLDPEAKMRPKYHSMPVAVYTRAPIKPLGPTTRTVTFSPLTTGIIPCVRVPIMVNEHLLEQPIGPGTTSSGSPS